MRKLTRSPKKKENLVASKKPLLKTNFVGVPDKITFRCDTFLLEKIKNSLTSQHLAGHYQYPSLSAFFRSALHAYQYGMALTYQRELNHPRKEISFRLTEELMNFYHLLPLSSKTDILERVLGSFYSQSLE
jgi:hypothetical protein